VSLLAGDDPFGVGGGQHSHTGTSTGIDRVGLPTTYYSDGPRRPPPGLGYRDADIAIAAAAACARRD
jgi:hypothetical protein